MEKKVLLVGSAGYVGGALRGRLEKLSSVELFTCDENSREDSAQHFSVPASQIPPSLVHSFDHILWFAGCSSVQKATSIPGCAFEKNVNELMTFCQRLEPRQCFVYASSSSVYNLIETGFKSTGDSGTAGVSNATDWLAGAKVSNSYDRTKLAFDLIANLLPPRTLGLRMGTVSGLAPNTRWELAFNAMARSAVETGVVRLANPQARRPILFLQDLLKFIELGLDQNFFDYGPLLDIASLNTTFGELATKIASYFDASILEVEDGATYSFSVDLTPLESLGWWDPESLEDELARFERTLKSE